MKGERRLGRRGEKERTRGGIKKESDWGNEKCRKTR